MHNKISITAPKYLPNYDRLKLRVIVKFTKYIKTASKMLLETAIEPLLQLLL